MKKFRLYHYWRSTSSWRVRWALALKGFGPEQIEFVAVNLLNGESESDAHRSRNPFGYVPALELLDVPGTPMLIESIAILEYLEERYPSPALLPKDPIARARVRALVESVNAGTQPLQNLTTQIHVAPESDPDFAEKRKAWAQHWIRNGMSAYEAQAKTSAGKFSMGDAITLADLCLIPQCYAALRNEIRIDDYPTIARIYENTLKTEGYLASEPDRFKPDAIPS